MSTSRTGARDPALLRLASLPFCWPVLVVGLLLGGCGRTSEQSQENLSNRQISISGQTMGTSYHIKLVVEAPGANAADELKKAIDQRLEVFNRTLSTWDPESEISRFNASESTDPFPVSADFLEVVRVAQELYRESGGLFDPTVEPLIELWGFGKESPRRTPPSPAEISEATGAIGMNHLRIEGDSLVKTNPQVQVNFSAIAKGYAVDLIADLLAERGYGNSMVEIGGEVVVRGTNQKGQDWTIGVDSPDQVPGKRRLIEILKLTDCAVATSGDYRNAFEYQGRLYSHILDPRTGWPVPESVKSVTVVAPRCLLADGAATAIMAMGAEKGLDWAEKRSDLEALVFVKEEGNRFRRLETSGMGAYLRKKEGEKL